ncbi:MAG: hypothetical protein MSB11_08370 [Prevotella sp.]|nr:hypothetical protein [Prevotella sp.]
MIRENPSARQAHTNPKEKKSVKRTNPSHPDNTDTTDLFFTDFLFGLLFYLDFYAPVRRFDFYGFNG